MRKILLFCLCAVILLAGCKANPDTVHTLPSPDFAQDGINEDAVQEAYSSKELLAVSVPAVTERYTDEDGRELFSYTAQHMQFIFPDAEVADKVILDFLNRVDVSRSDAEDILRAAQNDYTDTLFLSNHIQPYQD